MEFEKEFDCDKRCQIYFNKNENSLRSKCSIGIESQDLKLKYLQDVSKILEKYSWIYTVRNTDILVCKVLENIPSEWVDALTSPGAEALRIPFGHILNDWPDSLKSFIKECNQLGKVRFPEKNYNDVAFMPDPTPIRKTPFKKQYEINVLSDLIFRVCQETECYQVLDVGSGLGYLDQTLHNRYGIKSICLDSYSQYTKAAMEQIKKDPCCGSMQHKTLEVNSSEECLQQLNNVILEEKNWECDCIFKDSYQSTSKYVMIGLHSCGNLTQDMMQIFCNSEHLVAFVCVGCCYNKVDLKDFPMSQAGKLAMSNVSNPSWKPCTCGLRLAAQSTRTEGFISLLRGSKCMFFRAVFECFLRKENIEWTQPKRHIRDTDVVNFQTYCTQMLSKHPLKDDEAAMKTLMDLHKEKLWLFPRIRLLLIFQTLLQPLWEGFITVDRWCFFEEKNIHTQVISMWDDDRSSRNLALCAFKKR